MKGKLVLSWIDDGRPVPNHDSHVRQNAAIIDWNYSLYAKYSEGDILRRWHCICLFEKSQSRTITAAITLSINGLSWILGWVFRHRVVTTLSTFRCMNRQCRYIYILGNPPKIFCGCKMAEWLLKEFPSLYNTATIVLDSLTSFHS